MSETSRQRGMVGKNCSHRGSRESESEKARDEDARDQPRSQSSHPRAQVLGHKVDESSLATTG